MSIRWRIYGTFAIWLAGSLALGLAAAYVNELFLVPILVLLVAAGFVALQTRCPACGHPVLKREARTTIGHIEVWVPLVPKYCAHCGAPLTSPRVPAGAAVGKEVLQAEISRLSAELEAAFGDLPIPRPPEIVPDVCDEPECSRIRNKLGDRHWREVRPAELLDEAQALAFLTPEAEVDRGQELAESIITCLAAPDARHLEREQRAVFTHRPGASHFSGTPVSALSLDLEPLVDDLGLLQDKRLQSLSARQRKTLSHYASLLKRSRREDFLPGELDRFVSTLSR
jgi:hypothetical protein